jgi:acetyl-CoA synthetase
MFIVNAWADELAREPRPLSMGHALPGFSCAVLENESDDIAPENRPGRVAVNVKESPLAWFYGYKDAPERTAQRFSEDGAWYYTGDAGRRDEDGYFYFQSRDDDIILMAGYRIGPFDVESVLATHQAVQESAVIGEPDEIRGEIVSAYVVLANGLEGTEALAEELKQHVKTNYSAHAYPRKIQFVDSLPKTPSGKIQRFILRNEAK